MGGQPADGGGVAGRIGPGDGVGPKRDGAGEEPVSRDDAVVQDIGYIRLRVEETDGSGVVLRQGRLNGCDAEMFVALEQTCSG